MSLKIPPYNLPPHIPNAILAPLQAQFPDNGVAVCFDPDGIALLSPPNQLSVAAHLCLLAAIRLHHASILAADGLPVSGQFLRLLAETTTGVASDAGELLGIA